VLLQQDLFAEREAGPTELDRDVGCEETEGEADVTDLLLTLRE